MHKSMAQGPRDIALWQPKLRSADMEVLRDASKIRARARDLYLTNPFAQQAVRVSRQGVTGKRLRLSLKPDHQILGISIEVAKSWAQWVERVWEMYAHGSSLFVDAGQRLNFTEFMGLVHDTEFVDGEVLVASEWAKNRQWQTCYQVVDVDRLSNPHAQPETYYVKGGVALDRLGAPIGYHIREAHPADRGLDISGRAERWRYVNRQTAWGRPVLMHAFRSRRAGQTRGISEFGAVMHTLKIGQEYTDNAREAAALQAVYAMAIKSNFDWESVREALGAAPPGDDSSVGDKMAQEAMAFMQNATDYHEGAEITFGGVKIPRLFTGEELEMKTPGHPTSQFGDFVRANVKQAAAGLGVDPTAFSQDYSDVSYSAARMSNAHNWRTYETRRERLMQRIGMPMFAGWLEEAIHEGAVIMPDGVAPENFYAVKDALVKGTFITAGKPMIDPTKERKAQRDGLAMGLETLEDLAASEGKDAQEIAEQRAREKTMIEGLGLNPVDFGFTPQFDMGVVETQDGQVAEASNG